MPNEKPGDDEEEEAGDERPAPDPKLVEMIEQLDVLHEAAENAEARNQQVYDDTVAALGRIARRHFLNLGNWDPDLLRKLVDAISRAAWKHFEELDHLDYEQIRRDAGEPPRADRGLPPPGER